MFCPQCGLKIELNEQKFCHSCGFDLSQISKKEQSELHNLRDTAIHQVPSKKKPEESPAETLDKISSTPTLESSTNDYTNPLPTNAESSPQQTFPRLREASYDNPGWWERFKEKWGLGWIVLVLIYFNPTATKTLTRVIDYDYVMLLQLSGLIVSLSIYFVFRQRVLQVIQHQWIRSFVSGVIAITIAMLVNTVLTLFLPTHPTSVSNTISPQKNNSWDTQVSEVLKTEVGQLKAYLTIFAKTDKALRERFYVEPKTRDEIKTNISLLDKLIPLYHEKDSVMVGIYERMSNSIEFSPSWIAKAPALVSDFRSVVEKGKLIGTSNRTMLVNLRLYYLTLYNKDGRADQFLAAYESSERRVQQLSQELSPILQRITGKSLEQNNQDMIDRYYK
jgi:hypothetical protein